MIKRLLERHLRAQRLRVSLPRAEQDAELTWECPASAVVLEGYLALLDPKKPRGLGVEDLVYLLQLDEVVALADRPEPDSRQVLDQPWQLALDALDPAVPLEVQRASLLEPGERRLVDAELVGGETGSVGGAAHDLVGAEVTSVR